MADSVPITSRRALLAGPAALAVTVSPPAAAAVDIVAAARPDAALVRKAAVFIRRQMEIRDAARRLGDDRSPEGRAQLRALDAVSTRHCERLEEISIAQPTTQEGLLAQALVVLWEFNDVDSDFHNAFAWNLAESVFRVFGVPLPDWATVEGADEEAASS